MLDHNQTNEFTKPRILNFQVEVLRAVMQQLFIKREIHVVLNTGRSQAWLSRAHRDIACIVGKSYAECGDSAQLPDDVALQLIKEILLSVDGEIFEKNKDRKLPRKYRRWLSHPVMSMAQTISEEHVNE